MANATPLRYPGGKARLRPYVEKLIQANQLYDAHYVEPFCGGAAVAIELLLSYVVSAIHINDFDRAVYSFWYSVVHRTEELCDRIEKTSCDMDTWHEQKSIYKMRESSDLLDLGFATFFLNRTNRSGILEAGVIGGKGQAGAWRLDARYNKIDLIARIKAIGALRSRIKIYNLDAQEFLSSNQLNFPEKTLVYLDPPYVEKGPGLYLNHFNADDHRKLASWVKGELKRPWMVSYDDHPLIRECYGDDEMQMDFPYSAHGNAKRGVELVYFSEGLVPPNMRDTISRYRKPWHKFSASNTATSLANS